MTARVMPDALISWVLGPDTGISSRTVAGVLSGDARMFVRNRNGTPWTGVPLDSCDFGRCRRLLAIMPGWRERLTEVAAAYPEWGPLVDAWEELDQLAADGRSGRLCYRIGELLYGAMRRGSR